METTLDAFSVRRATPADAPALADLQRSLAIFSALAGETPARTRERVARQLGRCLADDSHAVFVATTEAGDLAGYASVHWLPYLIHTGPEAYVTELFVDEAVRGQGIGSHLLAAVEAEARRQGCERMQLLNFRTRESYRRGFYPRSGWHERPDGASFVKVLD